MLTLSGITKHYGPVAALRGVDFSLAQGEVHALLGENGAGKSTLLHVAYGLIRPDAGTIRVNGITASLRSPRDARRSGIGMVHQHFTSIEAFSVRENIELAVGRKRADPGANPLFPGLPPEVPAGRLSVALRQRLEIVKALATGARILLLDEPSAVLAPAETDELLARVRRFASQGGAVVLVTHKLEEAFAAADRVTVLRQGRVTLHGAVRDQTREGLADAMIGEGSNAERETLEPGASTPGAVLRIGGLSLHAGELIGIAAIEGQGQRELLRRIAGLESASTRAAGESIAATGEGGPVAFVPEDRTTEGLIGELSVAENLFLGEEPGGSGFIDWALVRARTRAVMQRYRILAPGPNAPARTLSGGNQQKLMLARALERAPAPRVLIAENPTRGLDVLATAEIRERLRAAARTGVLVIVASSDLDEILALADRVLVVREGRVREAESRDRRVVGGMMLGFERET